jgi:hypothetical protein
MNADGQVTERNGGALSRLREFMRNPISIIGLAIALVAFGNFLFLFFIDLTSQRPSPYVGILAYMVVPAFLVLGLILIPLGVWYDRRKKRQGAGQEGHYLTIALGLETRGIASDAAASLAFWVE